MFKIKPSLDKLEEVVRELYITVSMAVYSLLCVACPNTPNLNAAKVQTDFHKKFKNMIS